MDSPALSVKSVDTDNLTEEELDKILASYAPLSILPTPPPARELSTRPTPTLLSSTSSSKTRIQATPELEVYANHLSKLIPTNVSPQWPATATIQGFLERANLPVEIVAFAACILDALSQRFASCWRTETLPQQSGFSFSLTQQPCLDSSVIVLAALCLAHGFLSDHDRPTSRWARIEGASRFSTRQLELSLRCILNDIDYNLHKITHAMVHRMLRDMQRSLNFSPTPGRAASRQLSGLRGGGAEGEGEGRAADEKRSKMNPGLQGTAVWVHGMQTPEPSP